LRKIDIDIDRYVQKVRQIDTYTYIRICDSRTHTPYVANRSEEG